MLYEASTACKVPGLPFDIAGTAALYSQVAGILAGFAFTAILLPLTVAPHLAQRVGDSIVAFTCAFFSLILSAVSYAVLAGEKTDNASLVGRATLEELLAGSAFALGALLLFFGVTQLIRGQMHQNASLQVAHKILVALTAILGPFTALALLLAGASDTSTFRAATQKDGGVCRSVGNELVPDFTIALISLTLIVVVALAKPQATPGTKPAKFVQLVMPLSVLGLAVASTATVAFISTRLDPNAVTSEFWQHAVMSVASFFAATFGVSTVIGRRL